MNDPDVSSPFADLRGVSVARGDSVVLHDVNLRIDRGEHVAILGPNGCGKSTLLKVLTAECYPLPDADASVVLFGRERWAVDELRRHLGVVLTDLPGPSTAHATGLEAVLSGFFASASLWPHLVVTPGMRERATDALTLMDAAPLSEKRVGEMSAGEVRRILIARALVHRPEMLLLDEPTNALDLAAQRSLRETLRNLVRQGTGLLLITHHLPDILPEINRVILMREGRIVADGAKRELLSPSRLSTLFGRDLDVVERDEYFHALA